MILEFKRAHDSNDAELKCEDAIKQCHNNAYYKDYQKDPSISHIYLYGMAFYDGTCSVLFEEVPNH